MKATGLWGLYFFSFEVWGTTKFIEKSRASANPHCIFVQKNSPMPGLMAWQVECKLDFSPYPIGWALCAVNNLDNHIQMCWVRNLVVAALTEERSRWKPRSEVRNRACWEGASGRGGIQSGGSRASETVRTSEILKKTL